jgi:hypothetical protein
VRERGINFFLVLSCSRLHYPSPDPPSSPAQQPLLPSLPLHLIVFTTEVISASNVHATFSTADVTAMFLPSRRLFQ